VQLYIVVRDPTYDTFYNKAVGASSVTEVKQILKDFCLYVAEQHYVVSLLVPKNFTLYQPVVKRFKWTTWRFFWWSKSPPYNLVIRGAILDRQEREDVHGILENLPNINRFVMFIKEAGVTPASFFETDIL